MSSKLSSTITPAVVIFPSLGGGGAEAVAVWTCQALAASREVHLVSLTHEGLDALNAYFGTQLQAGNVHLHAPSSPFLKWVGRWQKGISLRQHLTAWYYRSLPLPPHVAICAFNEMDLHRPGLQYVHFPLFGEGLAAARAQGHFPDSPLRRGYRKLMNALFGYRQERMLQNTTLTNSEWTANIIRQAYGITPTIVTPPILFNAEPLAWEERKQAFIAVGRIEPEKEQADMIRLVERLREHQPNLELTLVTGPPTGSKYEEHVLELANERQGWVHIKSLLSREDVEAELASHQFGLHGKRLEHFGIAVAEMLVAGCLPMAFNDGGPPTILGHEEALLFSNWDEAEQKARHLLNDPNLQQALRNRLQAAAAHFSTDTFCREMTAQVELVEGRKS